MKKLLIVLILTILLCFNKFSDSHKIATKFTDSCGCSDNQKQCNCNCKYDILSSSGYYSCKTACSTENSVCKRNCRN